MLLQHWKLQDLKFLKSTCDSSSSYHKFNWNWNGSCMSVFFYSTCCGQGTWSLLQRKVRSERSGIKKTKVCTGWSLSGVSKMYIQWSAVQVKNELSDAKTQSYAKNLPKALTAVFSTSRTAGRAPRESSIRLDHCRRRGGVAFAALVCNPPFFLWSIEQQRSGYGTMEKRRVLSLILALEHPEGEGRKDMGAQASPHFFFFFGWRRVPSPPQGGEETASGALGMNWLGRAFFLLNMLWSRHVKPSPAKGEKRKKRN